MKTKPIKSARTKAMDYLARRHHSEQELLTKLKKNFPVEEVEAVLLELKERGWLLPPEELSERAAEEMHRKLKGHLFINHFLRTKGLPAVPRDEEREWAKAQELVQMHGGEGLKLSKVASLLKNRGFDTETIGKVIHEIRRDS